MMYISKIRLRDVRCFEDTIIDLSDSPVGTSVLIAGNNGIGKSAILRAIAMGLCDRDSAAALLRELEGNFIRKQAEENGPRAGEKEAVIEIEVVDGRNKYTISTVVTEWKQLIIETLSQRYKRNNREVSFEKFSRFWLGLFSVAYGAGLRTTGTAKYADYFAPDAMYSLFKYDAPLQDPEVAWRRLIAAAHMRRPRSSRTVSRNIARVLKHVLDLQKGSEIVLEPNGIFVKDGEGLIPLDAMGDGHKSLVKLTLDILVWYLLKINYDSAERGESRPWTPVKIDREGRTDVRGIVIIDEIEQHLHPRLQRQVLRRLHDKFPGVQFIITTHSPLCVSGTADVAVGSVERYKVYSLARTADGVDIFPRAVPRGLRADQILVDYFDLATTLSLSSEERIRELDGLMEIPESERSPRKKQRIRALLKSVERFEFGLAESRRDRDFQKRALEVLSGDREQ